MLPLILSCLTLLAHSTHSSFELLPMDVSTFETRCAASPGPELVAYLPSEDCAACDVMRAHMLGCVKELNDDDDSRRPGSFLQNVSFVAVEDTWKRFRSFFNEKLPRILFFKNGKRVVTPFFGTTKLGAQGVCRFLRRASRPAMEKIEKVEELVFFLMPPTDLLRDHIKEDPVSFVFVESNFGSFRSRAEMQKIAEENRVTTFFAHVRQNPSMDWLKVMGVPGNVATPALVRLETNRPTRVLVQGLDDFLKTDLLSVQVAKHRYPTIIEFGPHNFKDALDNTAGFVMLYAVSRSDEEHTEHMKTLEVIQPKFSDSFLMGTMDYYAFHEFLDTYLETSDDAWFAFNRTISRYWILPRSANLTELESFLAGIISGRIRGRNEHGLSRFLSLAVKNFIVAWRRVAMMGFVVVCALVYYLYQMLKIVPGARVTAMELKVDENEEEQHEKPQGEQQEQEQQQEEQQQEQPAVSKDKSLKKTE